MLIHWDVARASEVVEGSGGASPTAAAAIGTLREGAMDGSCRAWNDKLFYGAIMFIGNYKEFPVKLKMIGAHSITGICWTISWGTGTLRKTRRSCWFKWACMGNRNILWKQCRSFYNYRVFLWPILEERSVKGGCVMDLPCLYSLSGGYSYIQTQFKMQPRHETLDVDQEGVVFAEADRQNTSRITRYWMNIEYCLDWVSWGCDKDWWIDQVQNNETEWWPKAHL